MSKIPITADAAWYAKYAARNARLGRTTNRKAISAVSTANDAGWFGSRNKSWNGSAKSAWPIYSNSTRRAISTTANDATRRTSAHATNTTATANDAVWD